MISAVSDFLDIVKGGDSANEPLYRGQANSQWRVDCSAVRRLAADSKTDPTAIGHALVAYTAHLLAEASPYIATCPELTGASTELHILAQLQHQGAATGLMDFTTNPLVSLWFACDGHPDQDGAVYVLSRSEVQEVDEHEVRQRGLIEYFHGAGLRKEPPFLWRPQGVQGRAKSQNAVFVFGVPVLWPAFLQQVVIEKNVKLCLIEELREAHGIVRDTLFPDFAEYASANSTSQPFDTARIGQCWERRIDDFTADNASEAQAYVDCGLAFAEMKHYGRAIGMFTKAISLDAKNIGAYVNRAVAQRLLGREEEALEDYDAAVDMLEESDEVDTSQIGRVLWSRGTTLMKLGQTDQAISDQNRAIQLGYKAYLIGGRIVDNLEKHSQYRS